MKTILTLLMPAVALVSALASNRLFFQGEYLQSAALTILAYLAASLFISQIPVRKLWAR
jgi:hypothetical protein